MRRFVAVALLLMLSLPSTIWAQSVTISGEDWTTLLATYQTLKTQWETSNDLVLNLETALQRVRQQQQNSEQTISDLESSLESSDQSLREAEQQLLTSERRIDFLERQLQEASTQRDQLQSQLEGLEPRLIALAQSLTDTQVTADNALTVIEDELTNVLNRYETREVLLKWGVGIAVTVAVIEAVVIGVHVLSR